MGASERPRGRPSDGSELAGARATALPGALDAGRAAGAARIVVADDDRLSRELLATILRTAGHTVDAVEDGQEAVDRVAQGGVDLVLLDVVMPRLSGIEACRLLKGMTLDGFLPVVLVTVKTDTASRVEGLRTGADDYVCKPFEEQELLARVASMLRIKRLHDQVALQKARFERLSVHDELTGLYNYRYLNTRLTEEFKRAERYHEPFAGVLVDIDQLRAVNDTGGRAAGDAAIRRVAEGIRRSVREVDVVARYGGDEFLIVLPSTHFAGSVVVAERIWREANGRHEGEIESPRASGEVRRDSPSDGDPRWSSGPRELTVSIGVALYPSRDVRTKDALVRAADAALVQAKREGGNRICVFQQQGYIYTPSIAGSLAPPPARTRLSAPVADSWRPSDSGRSSSEPGPPPSSRLGAHLRPPPSPSIDPPDTGRKSS